MRIEANLIGKKSRKSPLDVSLFSGGGDALPAAPRVVRALLPHPHFSGEEFRQSGKRAPAALFGRVGTVLLLPASAAFVSPASAGRIPARSL